MDDNSEVKINRKLLEEFFKIAGTDMPEEISDETMLGLAEKLKSIKSNQTPSQSMDEMNIDGNFEDNMNTDNSNKSGKNILVVDDIGVVTYQLKILLQNLGYNVQVAKDIFNGINSFIHASYSFVVMDLFVSTEQEGYTLLNETKKIITQNNLTTKIIVITASNKAENRIKCMNGGADFFIKKDVGWQDKIIEIIENNQVKA